MSQPTAQSPSLDSLLRARRGASAWLEQDLTPVFVRGADASDFLTNLLSADLKRVAVGKGAVAFQCTPRGMAEAQLFVSHIADNDWLLLTQRADVARLMAYFERMHFSEQVSFEDASEELGCVAVQGAESSALVAKLSSTGADQLDAVAEYSAIELTLKGSDSALWCVKLSLISESGWLLLVNHRACDALIDQMAGLELNLVRPDSEMRNILRVESGVPKHGVDLSPHSLAQEVGIHHPAFSYNQGCYVGQEIIARINTKGEVPFRLMGLLLAGQDSVPPALTKLFGPDGKAAGNITSAVFSPSLGHAIAIARIGRGYQLAGAKLHVGDPAGPIAVTCEFPIVAAQDLAPEEEARSPLYDEALSLFARGEEEAALSLLRQELDANPQNWDAWEALGVILGRQERYQEAIEAIKNIAEAQPEHLMANVNLSLFFMKVGDKAIAESYQAKATQISLKRRMDEARAKGSASPDLEAERMVQLASRLEKFRAIIEMDPEDVLGHFGAGKACLDLKRFGEAAKHFQDVVSIQRDYSVAWANLGTALAALGEYERAKEVFQEGIEVARGKGDLMPLRDMQTRLENLTH